MKLISDDVIELVAGGTQSVTIRDERIDPYEYYPTGDDWYFQDDSGDNPRTDPVCEHTSPAPAGGFPAGIDLNILRNMVTAVSKHINTLPNNIAHMAIVYSNAAGDLRVSSLFTMGENGGSVDIAIAPGERVVAYLHSHTIGVPAGGLSNAIPSFPGVASIGDGDTAFAANLITQPGFDPNMLMYILDRNNGDTFEYKAAGVNGQRPVGPNITDDTQGNCTA